MRGFLDRAFLEELRSRIDLVDLVGSRIPLRRSGREFVARCPFHEEQTPSFYVSPTKQFYHCFGCGAHGDAIAFLMAYDHLPFLEAVRRLAEQCGLELPSEGPKEGAPLFELNRKVARLYFQKLRAEEGAPARHYLKARAIGGEIAGRFGLGYAPPGWRFLLDRFDPDLLRQAGLIVEKEGRARDRFRNRLIFPIRDTRGRVVGFGSRALSEKDHPKYLNSPETPIFQKRRHLYGLYELLQAGRPEEIVVVEGYFDLLALAQAGISNGVATLGTALSEEQLALLFRHAEKLVFCFDGDGAGLRAARRALELSLPHLGGSRQVRFLLLPAGYDPDSYLRREGAATFQARLRRALPLVEFLLRDLACDLDPARAEGRARLLARARPYLKRLPRGETREHLWQRLGEMARGRGALEPLTPPVIRPSRSRWLVALLLRHPELVPLATEGPERLRRAAELIGKGLPEEQLLEQLALLDPELSGVRHELEAVTGDPEEAREMLERALSEMKREEVV